MSPDIQVMAVVSNETPFFDNGDELDKFISSHTSEVERKEAELATRSLEELKKLTDRLQIIRRIGKLRKILEDRGKRIESEVAEILGREENDPAKLETQIAQETGRAADESSRLINSALVSFARELGLKLYFSRDMRIFREFSA